MSLRASDWSKAFWCLRWRFIIIKNRAQSTNTFSCSNEWELQKRCSSAAYIELYPVGWICLPLLKDRQIICYKSPKPSKQSVHHTDYSQCRAWLTQVCAICLQLLYEQGLSLRTMFLFMSACSAWHLIRTFFLMPRSHIPYPLPPGYTYG